MGEPGETSGPSAPSDGTGSEGKGTSGGAGSSTSAGGNAAMNRAAARDFESGDETASSAAASEEPEGWNSDDEPPQDHVGDEATCSRDSGVKKTIRRLGRGLERPGQYDIVRVRYKILEASKEELVPNEAVEVQTALGESGMPLAVEFAVRLMRVGEVSEVVGPLAYAKRVSPLYGRGMRNGVRLPSTGKVPRKLRFTPAAPRELHNAARAEVAAVKAAAAAAAAGTSAAAAKAKASAGVAGAGGEAPSAQAAAAAAPPPPRPLFRAEVELLHVDPVTVLTEDRSVRKHILRKGQGHRTPRQGDTVIFSLAEEAQALLDAAAGNAVEGHSQTAQRHTLVLGSAELPHPGLLHVLLSMREGERCLARLARGPEAASAQGSADPNDEAADGGATDGATSAGGGSRAESGDAAPAAGAAGVATERRVLVTMHKWRRHDEIPVPWPGDAAGGSCAPLQRVDLHPGPSRRLHAIEDGSHVLVAFGKPSGAPEADPWLLLSWRVGEGAVPGYLEAAVAGMRLAESASFEVPLETAARTPPGPCYEGQTPLRQLVLPELRPLLVALLAGDDSDAADTADPAEPSSSSRDQEAAMRDEQGGRTSIADASAALETAVQLPNNWATTGDVALWHELGLEGNGNTSGVGTAENLTSFALTVALVASTEALHVCEVDESEQRAYLDRERAHGNALAKVGRWSEASAAYTKALDAVRRTALYKALFPTERGHIEGAYSRDPGEAECPLERMEPADVEAMRTGLVALHLNLALCAAKAEKPREARRHSDVALGADPNNVKALFRRATASVTLGQYEPALRDLQRAAELQPQDRAVREELRSLKKRMEEHKEVQKNMFQNVFNPAPRKPAQGQSEEQPDAAQSAASETAAGAPAGAAACDNRGDGAPGVGGE